CNTAGLLRRCFHCNGLPSGGIPHLHRDCPVIRPPAGFWLAGFILPGPSYSVPFEIAQALPGYRLFTLQPARLFDPGEWSSPCLIALLQHRSMRFTSFSTSYPAAIGGKLQNRSVLQRVNKLI
ncbi:MAG: hypothetical protein ACRESZ_14810, partial [Methylococcales bacterium]